MCGVAVRCAKSPDLDAVNGAQQAAHPTRPVFSKEHSFAGAATWLRDVCIIAHVVGRNVGGFYSVCASMDFLHA